MTRDPTSRVFSFSLGVGLRPRRGPTEGLLNPTASKGDLRSIRGAGWRPYASKPFFDSPIRFDIPSGFYEHPTSTATATLTSTPTSTPTAVPTVTPNYYYGYLGPGYFSNNNLSYCNTGAYSQQTQNASSQWSIDTDINMFNNCTSIQVNVIYADFGNTNWVGRAHICNTSGQCDSNEAYNSTYSYCQVWLNSNVIAGNPFFYTDTEVQKLIMHEFGHCFSLDHSTDPTSVMGNGNVPNTIDIDMINARY